MSSRMVVILCPNGRRQQIKVTPNSSNLQILEDVCRLQGLKSDEFDLRHYNKILDLTSTVQFSNLPNNAQLELVRATKVRKDNLVQIGLQLENGRRLIDAFAPTTSLWDMITKFSDNPQFELSLDSTEGIPVCVYMRREILGEETLKQTTLRTLGLVGGNAIIRFTYRRPIEDDAILPFTQMDFTASSSVDFESNSPSSSTNTPVPAISECSCEGVNTNEEEVVMYSSMASVIKASPPRSPRSLSIQTSSYSGEGVGLSCTDVLVQLEARNGCLFSLDQIKRNIINEEPSDEFFEVTVEDIRMMMADLTRKRKELESAPLQTQEMKALELRKKLEKYSQAVIRVYFPDRVVLQGQFKVTETVGDVVSYVRHFLIDNSLSFYLYTTPPKKTLIPQMQLIDAELVPAAVVYFGSCSSLDYRLLRSEVYTHMLPPLEDERNVNDMPCCSDENDETRSESPKTLRKIKSSLKEVQEMQDQAKSISIPKWFKSGNRKN